MNCITPISTFLKKDATGNSKRRYGMFSCLFCGLKFEARMDRLKKMSGLCKKCSNKKAGEKRRTHGLNNSNSRIHVTWSNMKRRCLNPTEKEKRVYKNITLCREWYSFQAFMDWAFTNGYTSKSTIDRIDGSKGYSPNNCRFVGYATQSANRKKTDKNSSGFIGVYKASKNTFIARVCWRNKSHELGSYKTPYEASKARDSFIIKNSLPHTLNHKYTIEDIKAIKARYTKLSRDIEKGLA